VAKSKDEFDSSKMALDATLVRITGWIEGNYPRPKTDPVSGALLS
jgi:hypothetical protein